MRPAGAASKLLALFAMLFVAVGVLPLRASAEDNLVPITDPSFLDNGTYVFDSVRTNSLIIPVNQQDGPAMAIIDGDDVTLIIDIYAPDAYDKLFLGKRSEAPEPSSQSLLCGQFIPVEDYNGSTETWTDSTGHVGPAGNTYKAVRFLIPMTRSDFTTMLNGDAAGVLYITLRCASWASSNQLEWAEAVDRYVTLGTPTKMSNSTELPLTGFSLDDQAERVKKLIDDLPRNPHAVQESDRTAIEDAQAAYDALTPESQKKIDTEKTVFSQSYGRTLESLVWALDGLKAVDDSTTLPDGTYTTQATTKCSLGKSDSARSRMFKVVKVIVKDGHAQALIEHDTSTTDTVRTGSQEYRHINTDENAHSQFLIPIDLNSVFHISQFAKNATANTVGIVYEMEVTIDELNAKPDAEPATTPEESDKPDTTGRSSANAGSSTSSASAGSSATNGTRNNSSALSAVAQARQTGSVGSTKNTTVTTEKKDEKVTEPQKKDSAAVSGKQQTTSTSDDAGTTGTTEGESEAPVNALPFTFGMLGVSTALGVGGFTAVFFRRESRLIPWLRSA